jgi:hypothetical protein
MTIIAGLLGWAVDYWKYIAIAAGIAAVLFGLNWVYNAGRQAERQAALIEAGNRIVKMEQNNEKFRNASNLDRCRIFMRDSGLPESACK